MKVHSFSALDRHAVLSSSDDGFPWYAGGMLFVEASEVVRLRWRSSRTAMQIASAKRGSW
jgi:hypothetical protein